MIARRSALWAGIVLLWLAFIALAWLLAFHGHFGMIDFGAYYQGAQRLVSGLPLYQGFLGNTYIYPPLLAEMLIPLTWVSQETASVIWFLLNLGLIAATTAVLDSASGRKYYWWLVMPFFFPVLEAIEVGQITVVLLALLVGAWAAARQDRRSLCGVLLALAAWIKIYPALLILYFVWKRDWRVVRSAFVAGIVLLLLQIGISGIPNFVGLVGVLSPLTQIGQPDLASGNASVLGFVSQLFGESERVQALVSSPILLLLARGLISFALLAGFLYATARQQSDFDLEYALALLTSLLLSPTLFVAGMPPLLLVYALILRRRPVRGMVWFVSLACVILSLYWLFIIGYTGSPPMSGLLLSFGFYMLIATWGVNVYLLRRRQATLAVVAEVYSV